MKIVINIPNNEVKKVAATVALAIGETIPEELLSEIDNATEVDITDSFEDDPESKTAIQGFALTALAKLSEKSEAKGEEAQTKADQQ